MKRLNESKVLVFHKKNSVLMQLKILDNTYVSYGNGCINNIMSKGYNGFTRNDNKGVKTTER